MIRTSIREVADTSHRTTPSPPTPLRMAVKSMSPKAKIERGSLHLRCYQVEQKYKMFNKLWETKLLYGRRLLYRSAAGPTHKRMTGGYWTSTFAFLPSAHIHPPSSMYYVASPWPHEHSWDSRKQTHTIITKSYKNPKNMPATYIWLI